MHILDYPGKSEVFQSPSEKLKKDQPANFHSKIVAAVSCQNNSTENLRQTSKLSESTYLAHSDCCAERAECTFANL